MIEIIVDHTLDDALVIHLQTQIQLPEEPSEKIFDYTFDYTFE